VAGRVAHSALGQELLRDCDRVDRGSELLGGENILQNIILKDNKSIFTLYPSNLLDIIFTQIKHDFQVFVNDVFFLRSLLVFAKVTIVTPVTLVFAHSEIQ